MPPPALSLPIVSTRPSRPWPAVLAGSGPAARRQRQQVAAAAAGGDPVLILAEPGLDPVRVAEFLRDARPSRGFLALDCGESSTDILAGRLFGRPKPSERRRRDLDVLGRKSALIALGAGTVFLANVTELGAAIQRRLERILRDGEVYVDGRAQPIALPVRLVVSAAPDIRREVDAGRFRSGLFRRFAACQIDLVPLRNRPEDIAEVARTLIAERASRKGVAAAAFTPAALTALASLPWPRNLDELRDLLDRLSEDDSTEAVRQEDVLRALGFGSARPVAPRFDSLRVARQRFEREYIGAVLDRHGWRMAEAAATLGIERANLYRKIRQLGLPRPLNGAEGEH